MISQSLGPCKIAGESDDIGVETQHVENQAVVWGIYFSSKQHQVSLPLPHDCVVPSFAQEVEPAQQTSNQSQQYSNPVMVSRAQALGGVHL